jgi:hypothetical protein
VKINLSDCNKMYKTATIVALLVILVLVIVWRRSEGYDPFTAALDSIAQQAQQQQAAQTATTYSYVEGKDQDGQTIKSMGAIWSRKQCESFCNADAACKGIVTYASATGAGDCWTVKGFPSPYNKAGSAIAYKPGTTTVSNTTPVSNTSSKVAEVATQNKIAEVAPSPMTLSAADRKAIIDDAVAASGRKACGWIKTCAEQEAARLAREAAAASPSPVSGDEKVKTGRSGTPQTNNTEQRRETAPSPASPSSSTRQGAELNTTASSEKQSSGGRGK